MADLTLTEFLLARIAEDEAAALLRLAGGDPAAVPVIEKTTAGAFTRFGAAVRRIPASMPGVQRMVAVQYADHPDYREEWRP